MTWQENVKRCRLFIAVTLIVTRTLVTRMTYSTYCAQRRSLILLSYVVSVTAAIMSKMFFHVTIISEYND